jgi:lipoprotein-anchoring transpeptidase ErfK/SrfK
MDDLYINRKRSSKGCLRLIILLLAVVIIAATWYAVARHRRTLREDREFEKSLATIAQDADSTAARPAEGSANQNAEAPAQDQTGTLTIQTDRINPDRKPGVTVPQAPTQPRGPEQGPEMIRQAEKLLQEGDYASVRQLGLDVLARSANPSARKRAEELLSEVNVKMIMSPYPMPEKVDYTIARGDTLGELAKKYGTTVELIRKGNNISGSIIRIGDRFRILNGKFSMVVDKSDNDLVLLLNDRFFKRYRVGTGQYAKTPVGEYKITDRVAHPTWWRPDGKRVPYGDPENLLGTHWLSLNIRGYGLHGTWEPDTIGKQASAGCVRMLNEDIEELYTLVPIGTPVVIKD